MFFRSPHPKSVPRNTDNAWFSHYVHDFFPPYVKYKIIFLSENNISEKVKE